MDLLTSVSPWIRPVDRPNFANCGAPSIDASPNSIDGGLCEPLEWKIALKIGPVKGDRRYRSRRAVAAKLQIQPVRCMMRPCPSPLTRGGPSQGAPARPGSGMLAASSRDLRVCKCWERRKGERRGDRDRRLGTSRLTLSVPAGATRLAPVRVRVQQADGSKQKKGFCTFLLLRLFFAGLLCGVPTPFSWSPPRPTPFEALI